jgi:proline iminopeptidase
MTADPYLDVHVVGDRGAGSPLLVAHGGPGLHHRVYRTLDPLAQSRQLVYWDHRGHGRSAPLPAGAVSMSLFADDALTIADRLGLETFSLFGHSFGGWVAQELAVSYPDRVDALVLAATTPGQLGTKESPDDDQGPPPPEEVVALLTTRPADDAELIAQYTALAPHFHRSSSADAFVAALEPELVSADSMVRVFDALSRWSAVDRLDRIACPALVLAGGEDVFCSPQQLVRIARRVPDAELVVLDDVGHFMWEEDPARFFRLVRGWLDAH